MTTAGFSFSVLRYAILHTVYLCHTTVSIQSQTYSVCSVAEMKMHSHQTVGLAAMNYFTVLREARVGPAFGVMLCRTLLYGKMMPESLRLGLFRFDLALGQSSSPSPLAGVFHSMMGPISNSTAIAVP